MSSTRHNGASLIQALASPSFDGWLRALPVCNGREGDEIHAKSLYELVKIAMSGGYNPSRGSPEQLAALVCRRVACKHFRAQARRRTRTLPEHDEVASACPECRLTAQEDLTLAKKIWDAASDRDRELYGRAMRGGPMTKSERSRLCRLREQNRALRD